MEMRGIDQAIERRAIRAARYAWANILSFALFVLIVSSTLIFGLFAIEPKFEGTALVLFGRTATDDTSSASQKFSETGVSLARVAESDDVLRVAIDAVGVDRLEGARGNKPPIFVLIRQALFGSKSHPGVGSSHLGGLLTRVKAQLTVRAEPSSEILRITFRHRDPNVAAEFANALTRSFVDRYLELFSRQGAPEFFYRQRERFEEEFGQASKALESFSKTTQTYSTEEQRKLLLQRRNDLLYSVAVSKGLIAQKKGERQALVEELKKLAPVTKSPYLSSLVDDLGQDRSSSTDRRLPTAQNLGDVGSNPPLLMIKVYQDSMVALFKINAELAGAESLGNQQAIEARSLAEELDKLSRNEREFLAKKRSVDQAAANSDLYSRRMVEEQISAELFAAKISPLKILQSAIPIDRPVFPNYIIGIVSSFAVALIAAFGLVFLLGRKPYSR